MNTTWVDWLMGGALLLTVVMIFAAVVQQPDVRGQTPSPAPFTRLTGDDWLVSEAPTTSTALLMTSSPAVTWLTIGPYEQGGRKPPTYLLIGDLPNTFEVRVSATDSITLGELRRLMASRKYRR